MTAVAGPVPDLNRVPGDVVGIHDIEVMEPLTLLDVPGRRQYHKSSVRKTREVVLHTPAAERVFDAMHFLLRRRKRTADEIAVTFMGQRERRSTKLNGSS